MVGWTFVFAAGVCSALESFAISAVCLAVGVYPVLAASCLLVVASLVEGSRRLRVIGVATAVAVSGAAGGAWVGQVVYRAQVRTSCARGDALAAALETYRSTHGRYPARLEDLMPAFVKAIPDTWIGLSTRPFEYDCLGQKYSLLFPGPGRDYWIRGSDGRWSPASGW